MLLFFYNLKSVGFDLDDTLYPNDKNIDNLIRDNIAGRILEKEPELKNISNVRKIYDKKYKKIRSWIRIFDEVGINEPKKVLQRCLSDSRIVEFIKRDDKLTEIMELISSKYLTFLITNSPRDLSISKLNKIGIDKSLFNYCIFGDSLDSGSKNDTQVFKYFLEKSPYSPKQHVYVGDSLKADILPPKSLGMKTIAVGNEISEADFSIKNIYDIRGLLL